jgi:hypothetical protein
MYSQTDLNDAVAGGALTEAQANSLRSFIATRNGAPTADEEHFRFVKGFNDILCFTACFFALVAVGWLGSLLSIGSPRGPIAYSLPVSAPFAALFVAAASWGLAEIFTRQRRQWLTSILLFIGFTWGIAFFLILLLASSGMADPGTASMLVGLSLVLGGGAAFLHWKRFRQPIAIAAMYGFGTLAILSLLASGMGSMDMVMIIVLVAGIGAFMFAMWWDSKDPMRHSEQSEVGMWLHWLAALLIVNALATLFSVNQGVGSAGAAIGVIVLYLVFALIGLAVNRRAFVLTGLSPLMLALRSLMGGNGYNRYSAYDRYGSSPYGSSPYGSPDSAFGNPYGNPYMDSMPTVEGTMITLTIIGIILLLLAIFWAPLRRVVVGILPAGLRAKLPPTDTAAQAQATTFE